MNPNIFREYDIRGVVDQEITDADVVLLGKAIGTYMEAQGVERICLGRDCRLSADHYRDLLCEGLMSTGRLIMDIGVVTTPVLYFSVFHFETDGGVMITASHNPGQYNGFKVMIGKSTIHGAEIKKLYDIAEAGRFAQGEGSREEVDAVTPYSDYVVEHINISRPLKIAVDSGNGTAGPIALPIMERLGIEVIPLYCEMDGTFPNHGADPTVPANLTDLIAAVRENKLEAGVAFDGDCDRVGVVDEKGQIIFGDMLLAIFARSILEDNPGALFIGEVKCSKNLYDDIEKHGGQALMWRTGHSLIKQKMAETGALLAGEMSGHMFFKHRWFGFDDGIYAALRFCELLADSGKPLSTWLADMPQVVSTPEIRVDCADDIKFKVVDEVKAKLSPDYEVIDVDGVRVNFPDGWGLVRASNTQPALVLRFEAQSEARLQEIRDLVEGAVKQARDSL
ncbi:MAG: phosphomannomutase/phosphoglucomutase [Desulfarculaceae bacterium]|nr:phosphomannomutase/phosphoglucomutase [Desulfarculaceae bacterium]MCF8074389.1 phosphomannomutase/phosphoglucomutase [Desulfarculaceae bacterium]MCF8103635.1 phosphomannomutase/phosphoglucomutase [Desulfarculaceae bacterium]MCF8116048.1 phosphomannomutase/phosphoglucomutase [Desulfarculaceae bacterium]